VSRNHRGHHSRVQRSQVDDIGIPAEGGNGRRESLAKPDYGEEYAHSKGEPRLFNQTTSGRTYLMRGRHKSLMVLIRGAASRKMAKVQKSLRRVYVPPRTQGQRVKVVKANWGGDQSDGGSGTKRK